MKFTYKEVWEETVTDRHTYGGTMKMRERDIEKRLVEAVRKRHGPCPKWISPGLAGVPDRIILMPGGHVAFAELKAPGEKPCPLQLTRKAQLEQLGFRVFIIDNVEQIGGMLDEVSAP